MRRHFTSRIGDRLDIYQVHFVSNRLRPWLHGHRPVPSIWAASFIDNIKFDEHVDSDGKPWNV